MALADPPKDGPGKIVKQADGTCLYVYPEPSMECPPASYCNPGPPQDPLKVKCPTVDEASLPDAPNHDYANVVTRADGTCFYNFPRPTMHCPPNVHCNPGPPKAPIQVKCHRDPAPASSGKPPKG
jgi:hypothetical protein